MGTYKNGSDIDIALKGDQITFDTMSTIRLRLDELPYLYTYDVIDYKKISNLALTAHIDELGITFYKKEKSPNEWKTYKLSELVEIIPLYGSGGIMRYVDTPLYEQESILIPRKGTLSNLFYLKIPFWSVDTMFYTKIKAGNNGKYLYYLLKSMDLASMNVGSAVPSLTTEVLNKVEINVPDLSTQTQIAQILTSLDDKIELNLQMNQTLEAMAQALFKEWFVKFNYPKSSESGFTELNDLQDLNNKSSKSKNPENQGSDNLPKGWRMGKLGEEFNLTMGQSPKGETLNQESEGMIFYQGRTDFGFRFPSNRIYTSEPNRIANKLDTLVCVRAPVGDINMAIEKCCIGRGLSAVMHKSNAYSYTYYSMNNIEPIFKGFESEGTVFGSLNKNNFENIEVVVPSKELIKEFEKVVNPIDEKIKYNSLQIQTLTQTRDTLLPKLMSGKIEVKK
jgi:type I restriction enzyme S subunit